MKFASFAIAAGALALGLATWTTPVTAQGPLYDRVNVNLPYSVTIGDRTLQPGEYVIQQLRGQGGDSRVLLIYSDQGMKFETSAMTIPALDQSTPEDTKVVLHHYGPEYYFDKIWIQGKDYGYEFPLPDSVKGRQQERMEPIAVAAQYQAVPQTETTTTAQNTSTTTETTTVAPAPTPAPDTTAQAQPDVSAQAQPDTSAQAQPTTQAQPDMTAQNTAPPPAEAPITSADRAADTDTDTMPATSAGWLMSLLGGGGLAAAGLAIRRKR